MASGTSELKVNSNPLLGSTLKNIHTTQIALIDLEIGLEMSAMYPRIGYDIHCTCPILLSVRIGNIN